MKKPVILFFLLGVLFLTLSLFVHTLPISVTNSEREETVPEIISNDSITPLSYVPLQNSIETDAGGGSGNYVHTSISLQQYGGSTYGAYTLSAYEYRSFSFVAPNTGIYNIHFSSSSSSKLMTLYCGGVLQASGYTGAYLKSNGSNVLSLIGGKTYYLSINNGATVTSAVYFTIYRYENNTVTNPTTLNPTSQITASIDFAGDSDYYKFYAVGGLYDIYSSGYSYGKADVKVDFYLCTASTCSSPVEYISNDNHASFVSTYYAEQPFYTTGMGTKDFGFRVNLTSGYENFFYLIKVSHSSATGVGDYTLNVVRGYGIDATSSYAGDQFPDYSILSTLATLGESFGYLPNEDSYYYKNTFIPQEGSLYEIYHPNAYLVYYYQWKITRVSDLNGGTVGVVYQLSDLYLIDIPTKTFYFQTDPNTALLRNIRVSFVSPSPITQFALLDRSCNSIPSYTYEFSDSGMCRAIWEESFSAAMGLLPGGSAIASLIAIVDASINPVVSEPHVYDSRTYYFMNTEIASNYLYSLSDFLPSESIKGATFVTKDDQYLQMLRTSVQPFSNDEDVANTMEERYSNFQIIWNTEDPISEYNMEVSFCLVFEDGYGIVRDQIMFTYYNNGTVSFVLS